MPALHVISSSETKPSALSVSLTFTTTIPLLWNLFIMFNIK